VKNLGEHDEATIAQIERCAEAGVNARSVRRLAIKVTRNRSEASLPTKERISLSGVGFDIACGNLAIEPTRPAEIRSAMERYHGRCRA